ncbi:MAG: ornithine cyclodeaminase family protein [Pseudolabrys sp.]
MSGTLLYLSERDVQGLAIAPRAARNAVLQAFRDHAAGLNQSLPKSALTIGPGHGFQAMPAASGAQGIATLKWVAMAPVPSSSTTRGINGLIIVSDYTTGVPLAVLDGNEVTLVRTAAMSAAAASCMAPPGPATIGFVGCGLQAHAHLAAFLDLYPGLTHALAFSRSRTSAEQLASAARSRGLDAKVTDDSDAILAQCDIVISMVPGAPGLKPFLDARRMKNVAFACAVDIGRSWIPDSLPAFDVLATDSLAQMTAPYDVNSEPVKTVRFETDLVQLAGETKPVAADARSLFCYRGFAIADLAVAHLVIERARAAGKGTSLPL